MDLVIAGLAFALLVIARNVYVVRGLGANMPWPVSRGVHVATGYLFASLALVNPIAAVGLLIIFMSYQVYDAFKTGEDPYSFLKDLVDFAIGITIWAVKNGLSIELPF